MDDPNRRTENDVGEPHVLDQLADPLLLVDAAGRCVRVNQTLVDLVGYAREELQEMTFRDLVAQGPTWSGLEFAAHAEGGRWRGEIELRRKDGTRVAVDANAAQVGLPTGPAYLAVLRDLTERRQQELTERQFLAMVSHELRNPLTVLRGYAQLLQLRRTYDEYALNVILLQATRLERLIGDILDASLLDTAQLKLRPEPVDLTALLRRLAEECQALTRVHTVRLEVPDAPVSGRWDALRLEQIVQNLLTNARKYAPDGGEIVIRLTRTDDAVQVSVSDQGIGVEAALIPRLFDRFFRVATPTSDRVEGVGLGLYLVRRLVEAHGGRIWVRSVPGQGSTFTFTLPTVRLEE